MTNEPLDGNIQIRLILRRNRITRDFLGRNGRQSQSINQLLRRQSPRQVILIPQDEDGNTRQLRLLHQIMQLIPGRINLGRIRGIHDKDDGLDVPTVAFPHVPEAGLAANVPDFEGDAATLDLAHVEADGGDHVLGEAGAGQDVYESGFARVLQPY